MMSFALMQFQLKKYQYIFIFGLFECIEFALFHLFTLDIMGVGTGAKKGGGGGRKS